MLSDYPHRCAEIISKRLNGLMPKYAIIFGSGLGNLLINHIKNGVSLEYEELPGFPQPTIPGHRGTVWVGTLNQLPIICLQGRVHLYEGLEIERIKTQIRTLYLLGIQTLFITNAAGALHTDVPIGSLVVIKDHINIQGSNPLVGPNEGEYGPRFINMANAYDSKLRALVAKTAKKYKIPFVEGIYIGVLGPSFETAAEIRAFRHLGADVVGMSTISEVILARHCGLKVTAISAIANYAEGLSTETLSHEHTLLNAHKAEIHLTNLLFNVIGALRNEG